MHKEERTSAWREAQLGLFTGSIYGGVHTLSGHPLVQQGFTNSSAFSTAFKIFHNEGFVGFFRGCVPPLWGSMIYRGVMISCYEFIYTSVEKSFDAESVLRRDNYGMRPLVPFAAILSAVVRGFFESPIEYAKTMGQTGKTWKISHVYNGFGYQVLRTTGLMVPIFTILDVFRQKTDYLNTLRGNFVVTATVCGGSYLLCWPLETLKNLAQTSTPHAGATVAERIAFLGGYRGLLRGIWPGTLCGGLRNGCGMIAMVHAQQWATTLGLR